jgi:hypothetical protein
MHGKACTERRVCLQIFWLKREREMKDVLQAAENIRKILAGAAAE